MDEVAYERESMNQISSLRAIRADRLLSIRDLARLANVAPSTIYLAETGRTTLRPGVVRRLVSVLGIEPAEVAEFRRTIESAKAAIRLDRHKNS